MKLDLQWEKILDAMQKPFPALTHLELSLLRPPSDIEIAPVVPDSFMGGFAPRLQYLEMKRVPIRGLPKLLLSTTDLVHLILWRIPDAGYMSPEAIVTCLSTLPRLETLRLGFESPRSRPNRESRHLPPPTRSLLPALIKLHFSGVSEYLEDLVARIDSPLLDCLDIAVFNQLLFYTPQLIQFITRTPKLALTPKLKAYDQAHVYFSNLDVRVVFSPTPYASRLDSGLKLAISCRQSEWQLSAMAQACTSFIPRSFIHMVERLSIRESSSSILEWQDDIEDSQWLELLHTFTAVRNIYISRDFAPRIAPSLQELVGGRTTEVLPALQSLFIPGTPPIRTSRGDH
jgi:hypothetical protein